MPCTATTIEEQGTRPHPGFTAFRTAALFSGALYVTRYANLPRGWPGSPQTRPRQRNAPGQARRVHGAPTGTSHPPRRAAVSDRQTEASIQSRRALAKVARAARVATPGASPLHHWSDVPLGTPRPFERVSSSIPSSKYKVLFARHRVVGPTKQGSS